MSNLFTVTPRQAKTFITQILQAGLVPYVESSPGCGKSSIMKQIAKDFNLALIDHRLSTSEPTELSGLPHFNGKGEAVFAPFTELFPLTHTPLVPGTVGTMLFFDELPAARKETQAACFKLILDRMVGQHKLHDNCVITAAGNRRNDRALVNPISTAMASRLVHLELQVNFTEWLEDVAIPNKYDPRIIAFLSMYPNKLDMFDPSSPDKTFSCPRTYEFLNRLLKVEPEITDLSATLFAGTINSGTAVEFVQFSRVFSEIPSIKEILANPLSTPVPDTAALKWAVTTAILEHVDKDTIEALMKYTSRFTTDFRILFCRSINIRFPELKSHPAFLNALTGIAHYLFS